MTARPTPIRCLALLLAVACGQQQEPALDKEAALAAWDQRAALVEALRADVDASLIRLPTMAKLEPCESTIHVARDADGSPAPAGVREALIEDCEQERAAFAADRDARLESVREGVIRKIEARDEVLGLHCASVGGMAVGGQEVPAVEALSADDDTRVGDFRLDWGTYAHGDATVPALELAWKTKGRHERFECSLVMRLP